METKKNWLSENISSIIALLFLMFTFTVFLLILLKQVFTTESTTTIILASVTNILMLIIGFYFGSSKSGKDQGKQMVDMLTNKAAIEGSPIIPTNENTKPDTTTPTA